MEAFLITEPFHHIVFRDFYTKEELQFIWKELDLLSRPGVFLPPELTGVAHTEDGGPLSKRSAVFLDKLYIGNRALSPILSFTSKIYDEKIINPAESWYFQNFVPRRYDTLLSYYEDGDYYKPHLDESAVTSLTWLFKEPKGFTGGDLFFPDYNLSIECEFNSGIIFPSQIYHAVFPVKLTNENENEKMGRYCVTQLMYPDKPNVPANKSK